MKILITGGAGYIGSLLTPHLLRENHEVTVVDKFMYHQTSLLDYCYDNRLTIINGDARDADLIKQQLKTADAILPLACLTGAPLCAKDPIAARSTNLEA
ncbi:MAG: NAD-dependent epimerase/dehydratase family protein, partial [Nitrospinae bacterium]|nr:NAD-dependent epimerase/dehydratase family protein [Nitrospinota bacterium]